MHRGQAEATCAEALMRSRYAAFAAKEAEYLWRTLHPDHEDRSSAKSDVIASVRAACGANRYMGLDVIDREAPDAQGIARVLFAAKVFSKGSDRSFVELSEFAHDGEGWRYLRGDGAHPSELGDRTTLSIASFRARRGL